MSGLGEALKNISPKILLGAVGVAGAVAGGFTGHARGMSDAVSGRFGEKGRKGHSRFHAALGAAMGAASAVGAFSSAANIRKKVPSLLKGTAASTILGAVAGGVLGGLFAAVKNKNIDTDKRWSGVSEKEKRDTQTSNLIGGIASGLMGGASAGHAAPILYRAVKYAPSPDAPDVPPHLIEEFLRNVQTKAGAKSKFRAEARQHHPDLGGSKEDMIRLLKTWEAAQKHPSFPKHAVLLAGFSEELLHIVAARS